MPKTTYRLIIENACYHIMTRGNRKQRIFMDENDYYAYLARLRKYKLECKFLLYGFCLMPNHVHLFGEPKTKDGLAKFMLRLNRSYTAYFNTKYDKVGHLWQGRFKSKVIIKDDYLIKCLQYIELNPVRMNISESIDEYKWSSYKERALIQQPKIKTLDKLCI